MPFISTVPRLAPIARAALWSCSAGLLGIVFEELPDRYTLVGTLIIVGSTRYLAYREGQLSRLRD
jgi:hypothetical protein